MSRNKNKYRDKANHDKTNRLRQQQRQNELKAFLDYEQRLSDAYAARQAEDARRRLHQDSSG